MPEENENSLALRTTQQIVSALLIDKPTPLFDKQLKEKRDQQLASFLSGLERAVNYVPFATEIKTREEALHGLVREYFSLKLRERYSQLSREILELKRGIEIDLSEYTGKNKDLRYIEAPVFVSSSLEKEFVLLGEYEKDSYEREKITLEARVPNLNPEVREKAKEAMAYCYEIQEKALRTPLLGDLLLAQPDLPMPREANLLILWKPKPSELKVTREIIDRDPVLTLDWQERLYLVTTWSVEEEEPFEYFLKAYQIGGDEHERTTKS